MMVKRDQNSAMFRRSKQTSTTDNTDFEADSDKEKDANGESFLFSEHVFGEIPTIKQLLSAERTIFLALVAFRFVNALIIQTQYVPDEYWQSLEIAHSSVFGYGYETWEWKQGLRGYLYPSVFIVFYKILAVLRMDYRILLIKLPRVLQGLLAATGDFYMYKLSARLSGRATAQWTLLCQLLSWFLLYTYTRTLTNGAETAITIVALYYYPWPRSKSVPNNSTLKFLLLAGLSVIVRPTATITWVLMCGWHLQKHHSVRLLGLYIVAIMSSLGLSAAVDYLGYGRFVLVQYNFFQFNVMFDLGSHYGSHPWHWYITQGYPVVMATHMVPFILGAMKAKNKVLLVLIVWTILIYSFLSHKEFRFLLPIVPLSMHYCGVYFNSLCQPPQLQDVTNSEANLTTSSEQQASSGKAQKSTESPEEEHKARLSKAHVLIIILAVTNIPAALYFSLIHQRGAVIIMKYLHDEDIKKPANVLFLMPCHSTPYYSYLHREMKMRFLTCEPNLLQDIGYNDEAEVFFADPVKWLQTEYNTTTAVGKMPTHLVYYSSLHKALRPFLNRAMYHKCGQFFHTHFPDGRMSSHIVVSCKN